MGCKEYINLSADVKKIVNFMVFTEINGLCNKYQYSYPGLSSQMYLNYYNINIKKIDF